jgi:hypothetical protein
MDAQGVVRDMAFGNADLATALGGRRLGSAEAWPAP